MIILKKIFHLINWKKKIFPVIIVSNKKILMLAWINKFSLLECFYLKKTCFWSRSKKKYWRKGFYSNSIQIIKNIFFDCDLDSFLFKIIQHKNSCHYNIKKCFNYKLI